jgi:hypothetical protein
MKKKKVIEQVSGIFETKRNDIVDIFHSIVLGNTTNIFIEHNYYLKEKKNN